MYHPADLGTLENDYIMGDGSARLAQNRRGLADRSTMSSARPSFSPYRSWALLAHSPVRPLADSPHCSVSVFATTAPSPEVGDA